jgi:hypothetical protein
MATVKQRMQALGSEPQTCTRKFKRAEIMIAVEYDDGNPAGWHTQECIDYWCRNGEPMCLQAEKLGE